MIVIGIAGPIGSGKDVIASYLVREHGFVRVGFSTVLKEEVRVRFRRTLLRIASYVGPYVDSPIGPDGERHLMPEPDDEARLDWLFSVKPPIVRELLQEYGTEVRRNDDQAYWVNAWRQRVDGMDRVVVPDVRFLNEASLIDKLGRLVRVERPGFVGAGHASETGLAQWTQWSAVFHNAGTVEDLEATVAWWMEHP